MRRGRGGRAQGRGEAWEAGRSGDMRAHAHIDHPSVDPSADRPLPMPPPLLMQCAPRPTRCSPSSAPPASSQRSCATYRSSSARRWVGHGCCAVQAAGRGGARWSPRTATPGGWSLWPLGHVATHRRGLRTRQHVGPTFINTTARPLQELGLSGEMCSGCPGEATTVAELLEQRPPQGAEAQVH